MRGGSVHLFQHPPRPYTRFSDRRSAQYANRLMQKNFAFLVHVPVTYRQQEIANGLKKVKKYLDGRTKIPPRCRLSLLSKETDAGGEDHPDFPSALWPGHQKPLSSGGKRKEAATTGGPPRPKNKDKEEKREKEKKKEPQPCSFF